MRATPIIEIYPPPHKNHPLKPLTLCVAGVSQLHPPPNLKGPCRTPSRTLTLRSTISPSHHPKTGSIHRSPGNQFTNPPWRSRKLKEMKDRNEVQKSNPSKPLSWPTFWIPFCSGQGKAMGLDGPIRANRFVDIRANCQGRNFLEWIWVKKFTWKSWNFGGFFGGFFPACFSEEHGPKKSTAETKHQNPPNISGKGCPWRIT